MKQEREYYAFQPSIEQALAYDALKSRMAYILSIPHPKGPYQRRLETQRKGRAFMSATTLLVWPEAKRTRGRYQPALTVTPTGNSVAFIVQSVNPTQVEMFYQRVRVLPQKEHPQLPTLLGNLGSVQLAGIYNPKQLQFALTEVAGMDIIDGTTEDPRKQFETIVNIHKLIETYLADGHKSR